MRTVLFDLTILATDTRVRGIGRHTAELATLLAQASSAELRVLFLEHIGWDGRVAMTDDGPAAVARLCDPDRPETGRWSWAYRVRLGAARAARRAGAQVLHLSHSEATPLWTAGLARIVTCHDLIPLRLPEHYARWRDGFGRGRRWLDTRRFTTADHVIAISHATAHDLQRLLGVSPARITVVHHSIDAARWAPGETAEDGPRLRALGVADGFALYVGDADRRKNHQVMFAALAAAKTRGVSLPLVWAGRLVDERRATVQRAARRFGVDLRLLGYVDDRDLQALYRHAVVHLFVSLAEGFGLPVLEAMAAGCPVITSDCSSMAEVAGDGAWLVAPQDAGALTEAIVRLAQDDGERDQLRQRGLRRAQEFTAARQTEQTLAVYGSVELPGPHAGLRGHRRAASS